MTTTTLLRASGKDVFGCRSQLKADGFKWIEELKAWSGTQAAADKFRARGFRVKVFFTAIDCEAVPQLCAQVAGAVS